MAEQESDSEPGIIGKSVGEPRTREEVSAALEAERVARDNQDNQVPEE